MTKRRRTRLLFVFVAMMWSSMVNSIGVVEGGGMDTHAKDEPWAGGAEGDLEGTPETPHM
jgi:hypothetical protein